MSGTAFERPPRRPGPQPPRGEFLVEPPPEVAEAAGANLGQYLMYLPMVAGAGAMALMYTGQGATPLTYAASAMYGLSSLGMVASQFGRGSADRQRKLDGERRDYLRYLAQSRRRLRDAAAAQRKAVTWNHPEPGDLWALIPGPRMWERRPADPDFCEVRVAVGNQAAMLRLIPPETKPIEDLDPISAAALRSFVGAHQNIALVPVAVALRNYARVSFEGDPAASRSLVRALLAQTASFHAPEAVRVAVCAGPGAIADWDWIKWLPHALHPVDRDGAGPVRLIRPDLRELEALLGDDLADRPRFRPGATAAGRAHILLVMDGGSVPPGCQVAVGDAAGVTVLDVGGALARRGESAVLRLRADAGSLARVRREPGAAETVADVGRPDSLGIMAAEALARQLAAYAPAPGASADADAAPVSHGLPALLGMADLDETGPGGSWQRRAGRDRLRVPLGIAADGSVAELDLKESAQGGMGPHGLVIGATGSGKSELLRTLVLGLAMTHSSETLNLVLADFKGGATFLGLETLPHVSAIITNLAEELPLVDRMQDALRGEVTRRQELLRAAGNYASVLDYERARHQGAPLAPLPSLLIVVDEFSELLSSKPEFADLFVMIGRLGRSLGVHLLLASQRLEEGRLRGLETHLSYRICLRTFSANESRMVLGVPDAHTLPSEPGNAYLKFDVEGMTRFKAAYVSGPYSKAETAAPAPDQGAVANMVPYSWNEVPLPPAWPPAQPVAPEPGVAEPEPEPGVAGPTVLDAVVTRLAGQGPEAHRVWLPPLAEPPTLDQLIGDLHLDPARGLTAQPEVCGALRIPVAELDMPFEQRRAPLIADLSGAAGHVAVVGAPQSGKSTLLRSIISALALTHTPAEVQFHCLDFGGGGLSGMAGLPHIGSVASRLHPDLVHRTVAELTALLEAREKAFTEHGYDSMAAYRAAKAGGRHTDDPYGDVFLVIDGMGTLRGEFEALETPIIRLAAQGLAYGVHVVVAAGRWAEIRAQLRDTLGTRFELRLGDAFESEVNRHAAANVPAGAPGRGLVRHGKDSLHFLAAVPRIDGRRTGKDVADGVRALVAAAEASWSGPRAPAVRLLPDVISRAELRAQSRPGPAAPFGLGGDDLRPVTADFDAEPHFLVFGDTETGKTNLLRVLTGELAERREPKQAYFVVVDYRRGLLDAVPRDRLLAFAPTAAAAQKAIGDVTEAMRQRLPSGDLTAEQLRAPDAAAGFADGPELFVVVDDYDLVVTPSSNPMAPLLEVLALSRDIGLHVILARSTGGAGRAGYEPFLQRLKELGTPGVVLSGSPDEGPLLGDITPRRLPPGRGRYHRRRQGTQLVQTAQW